MRRRSTRQRERVRAQDRRGGRARLRQGSGGSNRARRVQERSHDGGVRVEHSPRRLAGRRARIIGLSVGRVVHRRTKCSQAVVLLGGDSFLQLLLVQGGGVALRGEGGVTLPAKVSAHVPREHRVDRVVGRVEVHLLLADRALVVLVRRLREARVAEAMRAREDDGHAEHVEADAARVRRRFRLEAGQHRKQFRRDALRVCPYLGDLGRRVDRLRLEEGNRRVSDG
mmetsp:Transcript_22293/g.57280  ORF Transcript_22293/g.57280 Transcript_22293/m.57280 type:complete len:226 (-) Transcript_22293:128-805(-)